MKKIPFPYPIPALVDRILTTCKTELVMACAGIVLPSLVIDEPHSFTRTACTAIGWLVVGAAFGRGQIKLRQS